MQKSKLHVLLGFFGTSAALIPLESHAASLLYQWEFDGATGAPAVGPGGTLAANGTAGFGGTGVSGQAGDNALTVSNAYTLGSGSGNSASAAANINSGPLPTFTLTMWVNLTAGNFQASNNFARLFEIGNVANPDNVNPGIYVSMANGGTLQYGVNGLTVTQTVPLLNIGAVGSWVFLALSYDGLSTTSFNSTPNSIAYGTFNNTVLLTGNTTAGVGVSNSAGINFTGTTAGPVNLGTTATAYLGNNSTGIRGATGSIDDVRLYNGQLTIAELEGVRLEAVPEPATLGMVLLGALGLFRRNRPI